MGSPRERRKGPTGVSNQSELATSLRLPPSSVSRDHANQTNVMSEPSTHSILRISDEKTLQLMNEYKKEECLWNTLTKDYKNKKKRKAAAERIAKILDLPHFTAKHVVIKFRNLRNSYCQELKKVASRVGYQPRVFWFSTMDSFLRPHLNQMSLQESKSRLSKNRALKEEVPEYSDHNPEEVFVEENISESEGEIESRNSSISLKRIKTEDCSQDFDYGEAPDHPVAEDSFACFGKYVAAMLRSMPEQKALELQPMIVSLLVTGAMSHGEGKISQSDEINSQ